MIFDKYDAKNGDATVISSRIRLARNVFGVPFVIKDSDEALKFAVEVAKKLNRHYVGIEIEAQYCVWAEQRLEMAESNPDIQGYVNGIFWERNSLSEQNASSSGVKNTKFPKECKRKTKKQPSITEPDNMQKTLFDF